NAPLVKLELDQVEVSGLIEEADINGLKKYIAAEHDQAHKDRAGEALAFLDAGRAAILKLDSSPFVDYVRDHAGGDYSDDAVNLLGWFKGLKVKRQTRALV